VAALQRSWLNPGIFDSAFVQFSRGNARRDFRGKIGFDHGKRRDRSRVDLKFNHIVIKISHIMQKLIDIRTRNQLGSIPEKAPPFGRF
jgi:hypothetical protein